MDVVRDLRRGAVKVLVLHYAETAPVTGVWISEQLDRLGYRISPGTLYPMLHGLEEEGHLEGAEPALRLGQARRAYVLTELGRATLAAARTALIGVAAEVLGHAAGSPAPSVTT